MHLTHFIMCDTKKMTAMIEQLHTETSDMLCDTDDPGMRLFLYGRRDALNKIGGLLGISRRQIGG